MRPRNRSTTKDDHLVSILRFLPKDTPLIGHSMSLRLISPHQTSRRGRDCRCRWESPCRCTRWRLWKAGVTLVICQIKRRRFCRCHLDGLYFWEPPLQPPSHFPQPPVSDWELDAMGIFRSARLPRQSKCPVSPCHIVTRSLRVADSPSSRAASAH